MNTVQLPAAFNQGIRRMGEIAKEFQAIASMPQHELRLVEVKVLKTLEQRTARLEQAMREHVATHPKFPRELTMPALLALGEQLNKICLSGMSAFRQHARAQVA